VDVFVWFGGGCCGCLGGGCHVWWAVYWSVSYGMGWWVLICCVGGGFFRSCVLLFLVVKRRFLWVLLLWTWCGCPVGARWYCFCRHGAVRSLLCVGFWGGLGDGMLLVLNLNACAVLVDFVVCGVVFVVL